MQLYSLVLVLLFGVRQAWAGDMAIYATPMVGDDPSTSVRQRVCDLYNRYTNNETDLANALSGLELRPIVSRSRFFRYSHEHGINETDPGLAAKILDELARRGNFTWRNSFAVTDGPEPGTTWTEALELYTNMFDISIDYWDKNSLRLSKGIAFLDQWCVRCSLSVKYMLARKSQLSFVLDFIQVLWKHDLDRKGSSIGGRQKCQLHQFSQAIHLECVVCNIGHRRGVGIHLPVARVSQQ